MQREVQGEEKGVQEATLVTLSAFTTVGCNLLIQERMKEKDKMLTPLPFTVQSFPCNSSLIMDFSELRLG